MSGELEAGWSCDDIGPNHGARSGFGTANRFRCTEGCDFDLCATCAEGRAWASASQARRAGASGTARLLSSHDEAERRRRVGPAGEEAASDAPLAVGDVVRLDGVAPATAAFVLEGLAAGVAQVRSAVSGSRSVSKDCLQRIARPGDRVTLETASHLGLPVAVSSAR